MNSLDYQNIFHEIKNSVTLINSSLQLLDRKCPALREELYWQNTQKEVNYLKNMILEISKTGNMEQLSKNPLAVNALVEKVCRCMHDSFPKLQWRLLLADSLPLWYGDDTKLSQALLNLLKNSAEAMQGTGCITVRSAHDHAAVLIQITDEGGGIPQELEDKIFDLFVTSKKQGTGLGLAITKQIIEAHNGSLLVDNKPGCGCTFSIRLPLS